MIELIHSDAFEFISSLEDNSVTLVVTDPPYGINYKKWDKIDAVDLYKKTLDLIYPKLKDEGSVWIFSAPTNVIEIIMMIENETPFIHHRNNWSIWARQKGRGSSKRLKSVREDCLFLTKSKDFVWNETKLLREVVVPYIKDGRPRGWFIDQVTGKRVRWTGLSNVWNYSSAFWKSKLDPQIHPSQKPILMLERLIKLSSNEQDLVVDPFCGSGSIARACQISNRNFKGCDNDLEMLQKAWKWIKEHEVQKENGLNETFFGEEYNE